MKHLFAVSLIFISCLIYGESRELPSYITKCARTYPQVNDCIMQRIEELKPLLLHGIPELKLPGIQPFFMTKVEVETGDPASGAFHLIFANISVFGVEDFQVDSINSDMDGGKFDLKVHIPHLFIDLQYNIKGKLIMLELDSSGSGKINVTNIKVQAHAETKIVTRNNGKRFVEFYDQDIQIQHDKPSVHFSELFRGNLELTEETNRLLNENLDEFDKDIRPLIRQAIKDFVAGVVLRVFDDFALEELFEM